MAINTPGKSGMLSSLYQRWKNRGIAGTPPTAPASPDTGRTFTAPKVDTGAGGAAGVAATPPAQPQTRTQPDGVYDAGEGTGAGDVNAAGIPPSAGYNPGGGSTGTEQAPATPPLTSTPFNPGSPNPQYSIFSDSSLATPMQGFRTGDPTWYMALIANPGRIRNASEFYHLQGIAAALRGRPEYHTAIQAFMNNPSMTLTDLGRYVQGNTGTGGQAPVPPPGTPPVTPPLGEVPFGGNRPSPGEVRQPPPSSGAPTNNTFNLNPLDPNLIRSDFNLWSQRLDPRTLPGNLASELQTLNAAMANNNWTLATEVYQRLLPQMNAIMFAPPQTPVAPQTPVTPSQQVDPQNVAYYQQLQQLGMPNWAAWLRGPGRFESRDSVNTMIGMLMELRQADPQLFQQVSGENNYPAAYWLSRLPQMVAQARTNQAQRANPVTPQITQLMQTYANDPRPEVQNLIRSMQGAIQAGNAQQAQMMQNQLMGLIAQTGGTGLAAPVNETLRGTGLPGDPNLMPSYAVGTQYVPQDQIAQLHKGEAVVPAKMNTPSFQEWYRNWQQRKGGRVGTNPPSATMGLDTNPPRHTSTPMEAMPNRFGHDIALSRPVTEAHPVMPDAPPSPPRPLPPTQPTDRATGRPVTRGAPQRPTPAKRKPTFVAPRA